MKSQLHREFRARQFSRPSLFSAAFHDEHQLYGPFSHPNSFHHRSSSIPLHFSSICPPLSFFVVDIDLHFLFSFSSGTSVENVGQKRNPAWNSRANWILIIPAFLSRVLRVPFLSFFLLRSSDRVLRYALPHVAKKKRHILERDENGTMRWSGNQKSERSYKVALMTCTWLPLKCLSCFAVNYFVSNWIDTGREKAYTQALFISQYISINENKSLREREKGYKITRIWQANKKIRILFQSDF